MWAALNGHLEVVELLIPLEAGIRGNNDCTALIWTARFGRAEAIALLIPHEAKMQDRLGYTGLMMSALYGYPDVVGQLIPHEAGMRGKSGETATTIAATHYESARLRLLLESEAEREASGVAPVMVAAYRGDIRELVARRGEWQTECIGLTVLDFALIGRQRRAATVLVGPAGPREFFTRQTIRGVTDDDEDSDDDSRICRRSKAGNFISSCEPLVRECLPVICAAESGQRARLFMAALLEHPSASRCLRPVCTPGSDQAMRGLGGCTEEATLLSALRGLKHLGFSADGKTVLGCDERRRDLVRECLKANPLWQKHARIALGEAGKRVPEARQVSRREVEAESAFNRGLLAAARDAAGNTTPISKSVQDRGANRIAEKQQRCRAFLMSSMHIMWRTVTEMLAE